MRLESSLAAQNGRVDELYVVLTTLVPATQT